MLEIVSFETAMQRLIEDAPNNFKRFRGANRTPDEPVVTEFDCAFAVDSVADTCIALMDYDVPRARLNIYGGKDEAAAQVVFEFYDARLRQFASGPAEHGGCEQEGDEDTRRWSWTTYAAASNGAPIGATRFTDEPKSAGPSRFSVWVEIAGTALECIEGSPEDSPWRILLGHDAQLPAHGTARRTVRRERGRPRPGDNRRR